MRATYNRARLAAALGEVGMRSGDTVFSHSNIGYFGFPEEGTRRETVCNTILGAFQDVLGPTGTLVVPTFSYSFCKGEVFDPDETPSDCGIFSESIRRLPQAQRSHDPLFSVTAVGRRAEELTANVSQECFGAGSFWDRFLEIDGILCNLNRDAGSTFLHFIERRLKVPYRFDKAFTGTLRHRGESEMRTAIFFCRDLLDEGAFPAFEPFDGLARERGFAHRAAVGRGAVVGLRARDALRLVEEALARQPRFLTKAGGEQECRR